MEEAWTLTTEQVIKRLSTHPTSGLDSSQVPKRQAKYGVNGNNIFTF